MIVKYFNVKIFKIKKLYIKNFLVLFNYRCYTKNMKKDNVDKIIDQCAHELPDLDASPMAVWEDLKELSSIQKGDWQRIFPSIS